MVEENAIVIGSGIAGMAAAVRLAVKGFEVHVYEKNNYPGGKISLLEKKGFRFDTGPSLFTQPQYLEELFALAEEPISAYFNYRQLPISCKYLYDNGKIIDAYSKPEKFASELKEQLGESPDVVMNYLRESKNIYNKIGAVFLNYSLHKKKTWFNKRIIGAIKATRYEYLFKTLHTYNKARFTSSEAVQLFDRYATYNGSNPYKAPGMLSLIPHLEYNEGTYYPIGGMISIADALYKLAIKKGVKFHFNAAVSRIIHYKKKIKGVVVNGQNILSSIVISNMDIYFTYKNLLLDEEKSKHILKQERSSSALVYYWGIKKEFPALQLHNIFFSSNYKEEFDNLFQKDIIAKDPTVYLNITSKMEHTHAPLGKENWFIMINAPANVGQDWTTFKQQARQNIIAKLNRVLKTDIAPLIETEEILDPVMIEERTASYQGSLYGTSSNSRLAAFFRHSNFSKDLKGLFFAGGSVHPGGGIPLCLKSAKIVSELIERVNKNTSH